MNPMHFFTRIRRGFTSFFRMLIRLPRSMNLIELTVDAVSFPQQDWARRIRRNLADDHFEITWQQAVNPLYWLVWLFRFSARWIATRPYTTLTPAIPALVVISILIGTVWVIVRTDETAVQTVYLDTLLTSLEDGDTEVASVAAQRLLSIDPENLEHQYQLAILEDKLGRSASARRTILELALQKNYGPAALWLLKALIYQEGSYSVEDDQKLPLIRRTQWTDEERELCHHCAKVAMANLPTERAIFATKMYAGFLADNGYPGEAMRYYASIAKIDPSFNLAAAQVANQIAQETGDYLKVEQFARAAIRYFEPRLQADPTSVTLRIRYAQALVLDERDEDAIQILEDGHDLTGDPLLESASGEAYVFRAERVKRTLGAESTLAERGGWLHKALNRAPKSPIVLEAVVQFAIECQQAEDKQLQEVREKLLSGVDPPAMHFIEGTVALMRGDNDAAQMHLTQASKEKEWKNMAGLLNNLAVTLASSGNEDQLPQALQLSEAALKQLPDHPYLLETRGQIYLKLERYQDAIADLEKALINPNMRPLASAGLAKAYEALGMEDLAKEHRKLAEQASAGQSNQPAPQN